VNVEHSEARAIASMLFQIDNVSVKHHDPRKSIQTTTITRHLPGDPGFDTFMTMGTRPTIGTIR
jgi:hypothetical protein